MRDALDGAAPEVAPAAAQPSTDASLRVARSRRADALPPLDPAPSTSGLPPYRHEAFHYAGTDEFVTGMVAFLEEGIERDEPALVVVSAAKIDLLKAALNGQSESVQFADMATVGRNPARIIPAWADFVDQHAGRRAFRGIGEPIYPERSPEELVECQRHEALLNLAFSHVPGFWLMCPYDISVLDADVIDMAARTHRHLADPQGSRASSVCLTPEAIAAPFDVPLTSPPTTAIRLEFSSGQLETVRSVVGTEATRAGFDEGQRADFVIAVNEVASNSLLHGGGRGVVQVWSDGDRVVAEVHDAGEIADPLVGRRRPPTDRLGGRGLWLAHQLCDLVQVRGVAGGTAIRLTQQRGASL